MVIAAEGADFSGGGGGGFRGHDRSEKNAVLPGEGFVDQWHAGGAAAAEKNRGDRHALGILPFRSDHRALPGGRGKAGVGMGGLAARFGIPGPAHPVAECLGGFGHFLPPDVIIAGEGAIGENAVARDRLHGVGIREITGAGGDAEKSGLRIDGIEAAIVAPLHPGDVVANGFDLPAGQRGIEHGQIRFATGGGKRPGDVLNIAPGIGEFQDEHMLGQPAFIAGLHGGDAQGVTFFSQERVAAIARAIGPDFAGIGKNGRCICWWR